MKKSLLRTARKGAVATTAIAALTLAACSSSESTDGASGANGAAEVENADGRGPITFAMGSNDLDKIQPIVDAWNADHPDEQVTIHDLGNESGDQRNTLVQSLEAGNAEYDVMALDVIWTGYFAAQGWLVPLEGDFAVDTSGLLQPTVDSATYNDTLYALPQNTNGQLLFRNTDLAPEPVNNFEDVRSACEALQDDQNCLITQLSQYEGITVNAAGFMEGWGGSVLNDDQSPNVDSAESKEGLQALVDAVEDETISPESQEATEAETEQAFLRGDTAFAINWPYMFDSALDADGSKGSNAKNVEVQPLVGKDGVGVSTLGGYNNGININSEHKATALDFIKFIISEESQMSFAEKAFPPVLASIYDDAALAEELPYLPALKESLENAVPRPVSPFYDAISKAIQDNAYAALYSGKSVDDATADMKSAIESAQG